MDHTTAQQTLRDYAEGRIGHTNAGSCPVCQALDALAGAAPAAVAGPAWSEQQVHALAVHMAASAPPSHKPRDYDADMAWARSAMGFIAAQWPAPAGWRLVPAAPTRDWIAAVADGGYEDCDCASLIADILSRAPAAPALGAPAAPARPSEADIAAAREHIADVHNATQMRSALSQLRPDVVVELVARGLVSSIHAHAGSAHSTGKGGTGYGSV